MLEVGTKAPDFELPDQNGELHKLSDYTGKKVILYFYPKDSTAGCTKQACGFSERHPQFTEKGAVVLGVSKVSMGVVRTTYLIDEQGIIVKANGKVKAAEDAEKMLQELE